jgi:hypothetical protein
MNPRRGYGRGFGRGFGRGWGKGFGRGFGRGWYMYPPPTYPPVAQQPSPEQEVVALENYKEELAAEKADLEKEIVAINSRIEELTAKIDKNEQQKEP